MSWKTDGFDEEEFDGDLTALQEASAKKKAGGMTRLEQLEHEMKLLSWHKLANEAALKAAIIRTKNLKKHDRLQLQKDRNRERAAWMEQIIREEQMKPLEVNTHFIQEYEKIEKKNDADLERTIEHHLHNLRKLKKSIEEKDKIRQRKEKFYAKRNEVRARIASRMGGSNKKALSSSRESPVPTLRPQPQDENERTEFRSSEDSGSSSPQVKNKKALELVVGSLDKLMRLERRINVLEQNMQDKAHLEQKTAGSLSQLGMLRFRKKKIQASLHAPAKTLFSVSMNAGNDPTNTANQANDENQGLFVCIVLVALINCSCLW